MLSRREEENGTSAKSRLQDEEGTYVELGLQDETFSLNFTSLLIIIHFCVFGSEAWAHIPDEKHKSLEPKSENCIFVGYSKDVKGYRILQPNSIEITIKRHVKFDKNILAYDPDLAYVPSSACEPHLAVMPSSSYILENTPSNSSSDTDNDDENPPRPVPSPTPSPPATSQLP